MGSVIAVNIEGTAIIKDQMVKSNEIIYYEAKHHSENEPVFIEDITEKVVAVFVKGEKYVTQAEISEIIDNANRAAGEWQKAALNSMAIMQLLLESNLQARTAISKILMEGGLNSELWWDDIVKAQQLLAASYRKKANED